MPSNFKNDAVAVLFDAKSQVSNEIAKVKLYVQEKAISITAQSFQPKNRINQDQMSKVEYTELIQKFEEDMVKLSKNTKEYGNLVNQLK